MFRTLLVATTALTLVAAPTIAQVARPSSDTAAVGAAARSGDAGQLRPGQTVSGELRRGDDTLSSGEYNDRWAFPVRRGQTYEVSLTSTAFDPYLLVRGPGGLREDNDDGEDGTDSRQQLVLPEDGEYEVLVTSYRPGETGSYRFSVGAGREPPRQAPTLKLSLIHI